MANGAGAAGAGGWFSSAANWIKDTYSNAKPSPGLATALGTFGSAISPEGSWQQRLGAGAAKLGKEEQSRRYLAELLGTSAEKESEEEEEESALSTGQMDALRNPGLGSVLSDYFSKTLPKTGR